MFVIVLVLMPDRPCPDRTLLNITGQVVPDDQNGFVTLKPLLNIDKEEKLVIDDGIMEKDIRDMESILEFSRLYADEVSLIKEASKKPYFNYVPVTQLTTMEYYSAGKVTVPDIKNILILARISLGLSWIDYKNGELEKSFQGIFDMVRLAQLMRSSQNSLITYAAGVIIMNNAYRSLNYIIEDMPVIPDEFMELIPRLQMAVDDYDGLRWLLEAKCSMSSDLLYSIANGDERLWDTAADDMEEHRVPPLAKVLFKPGRTVYFVQKYFKSYTGLLGKPFIENEFKVSPFTSDISFNSEMRREFLRGNILGWILATQMATAMFEELVEKGYYSNYLNYAMQMKIALLTYEKDHGVLPETVDDIVPGYLDSIRMDPFDGRPLRYDRERAIVYSVGKNCEDFGGVAAQGNPFTVGINNQKRGTDMVVHLHKEVQD